MKRLLVVVALAFTACPPAEPMTPNPEPVVDPLAWANPAMGTGGFAYFHGSAFPGACVPHGLVKAGPDTRGRYGTLNFIHYSGYWSGDDTVMGFSQLHLHGTGATDWGVLSLMPVTSGEASVLNRSQYQSRFGKRSEVLKPGSYEVTLDKWNVKAELTASTHVAHHRYTFADSDTPRVVVDLPDGFAKVRQSDPSFTTEALEDRASLVFWKWIEAQSLGDPSRLAKVAQAGFTGGIQKRQFRECAVGAVNTQQLASSGGTDVAAVEVKWSAKVGNGPTQPLRYVLLLERASGAKTPDGHGMSTNRCSQCGAPLSDNGQPTCEFCGNALSSGQNDWVLRDLGAWEWWRSQGGVPATSRAAPAAARVPDREERERLVYLMAVMAKADGVVDANELKLLKMASDRWNVPWAIVELALNASGDGLFGKLIARGSGEAESFMRELVQVAMADGKIDSKERKLLASAALHLGLESRLNEFLK